MELERTLHAIVDEDGQLILPSETIARLGLVPGTEILLKDTVGGTTLRLTEISLSTELVMKDDYILEHQHLEERLVQLGQELPGTMSGFARLHRKAVENGALQGKVKEMMALAISIVVGCDGCIAYHVHDAAEAGATRQELLETIGVALLMGGGPGSIYAAHALDAIEQFIPQMAVAEP